jgi:hypothetical protein
MIIEGLWFKMWKENVNDCKRSGKNVTRWRFASALLLQHMTKYINVY